MPLFHASVSAFVKTFKENKLRYLETYGLCCLCGNKKIF